MAELELLRYPVGRFERVGVLTPPRRVELIASLERLPSTLRGLAGGLDEVGLGATYRPEGWTVRQLVHHLADSHINAYIRIKLALTEDRPPAKPYDEAVWAELADAREAPVQPSLDLLDGLHRRWVLLLRSLPEAGFQRAFLHPDWGAATVDQALALYEWHGRHHAAHIRHALTQI